MGLARAVPRGGDLPALLTYECKQCGVWLTEAEESGRGPTIMSGLAIPFADDS